MSTLVLQSHMTPLPHAWIEQCLSSVRAWARNRSFAYKFIGDETFQLVDTLIRDRYKDRPVILSDLARLIEMERGLKEGFNAVIWLDADTLILKPDVFHPLESEFVVGREHWIQQGSNGTLTTHSKVHNGYLYAREGSVSLPFYAGVSSRFLKSQHGQVPDQFIGPKLLTALHNVVQFEVQETAAAFSPAVIKDVINGGGPAQELLRSYSKTLPAAVNLCASSVRKGELSDDDMLQFIQKGEGWVL